MDEIIYLEPDEEITSVIDKMKRAKSSRLGLVIPREATLLQSVVNLRLLQREANILKKDIAVVTPDKIGRNLAAQVGLQVYNSIEERKPIFQSPPPKIDPSEIIELDMAPKKEEENVSGVSIHHFQENRALKNPSASIPPAPRFDHRPVPTASPRHKDVSQILGQKQRDFALFHKIVWPLIAVVIILALVATYLFLPHATVTAYVPSTDLQKEIVLSASTGVKTADLEKAIVPGQLIESSAEKKDNFPATGQKNIGTKAAATITLYNSLDSNGHSLPAGAKLSSSSKTFLLKSSVTIPGAGVSGGSIVPGSIKADIEAEDVGAEFNVKAGRFTILSLSATQQAGIYGQSATDLTGGSSRQVQVISQQDYDNAKNKLIADLSSQTKDDLQKKIGGAKVIDKATVTPEPEISTSAQVNAEGQNFDMDMKYKQQVMIYDNQTMKDALVGILQKQVSNDKQVAIASDNDIGMSVTNTAYDKGELDLKANVLAKVATKLDTETIKNSIIGKTSAQTESIVKGYPTVNKVTIDFWPLIWFKRLPYLSRNIQVNINYQTQ